MSKLTRSLLNIKLLHLVAFVGMMVWNTAYSSANPHITNLALEEAPTLLSAQTPMTLISLRTKQENISHQGIKFAQVTSSDKSSQSASSESKTAKIFLIGGVIVVVLGITITFLLKGVVVIGENEVGIVYKRFACLRGSLPPNQRIALNGEAGYQAHTLSPGFYWGYLPGIYTIRKQPVINIYPNEIGLVEAKDGQPLRPGQNFGKIVECNDFQDAQAFLKNGGQRGKQLAILTAGTYQINTELFRIQKSSQIHIDADKIGLVEAQYGFPLASASGQNFGKIVECNDFQDAQAFFDQGGQKGKQLAILKAGTYQINTDLFEIRIVPVINVPPSEIALVIAQDGVHLPSERILGKVVECNNFQDAQAFLKNGGQKGKQLAILTAGIYQINTDLFTVITTVNATEYNIKSEELKVYKVDSDKIGIVTTLDGATLPEGEIAGSIIEGHNKFQDAQKFIDAGGYRGLQEEFLQAGYWNLNPWFVTLEQVPLTEISFDQVGVIISYIGKNIDSSSANISQYQLVDQGYKGVQKIPLRPGKYPINTRVKSVEVVPTNEIILNWSDEPKPDDNYDTNLKALKLRSKDGFTFDIRVTQVISIAEEDAPRMILRVGAKVAENSNQKYKNTAIKNLVSRVLGPMIDSFFRNSAQGYEALDFQDNRVEIQRGAEELIKAALNAYGVQAISTLINEIDPPDELEELLKQRTFFEEQRKTIEAEKLTEQERQSLIEERERTKAQVERIKAERELEIADLKAKAKIKTAEAEAKSLINNVSLETERQKLDMDTSYQERLRNIEIEDLKQSVLALSPELYAKIELEKTWSYALAQLKIDMPEIFIGGSSGSSPGADALQAGTMQLAFIEMLRDSLRNRDPIRQKNLPQQEGNITFQSKSTLINISGVTGQYVSQIPVSHISTAVTKIINQLPDSPQSEQPTIKKLLTQLQAAIEVEKELNDEDKIEALEQLKTLAELGQNLTKDNVNKPAKVAINILKLISHELPNTSNLVEHFNQLLPAITHLFDLGQ
ncbi:hypothetical protein H6G94_33630 [Nostoc punctiforme FACHB-252]|uniref:Band 7 domain-containing protein n=1 Tax=Nostoc punctiforme FACHB-252 TaxID=1357509 RepID=A0ABR8HJY9_NOSPU|nr:SPFH domain-containing protein [Nostoc punctiforme]MBD2616129.1 hypothetical protein [Nostoc punctiforme FACHB-252]